MPWLAILRIKLANVISGSLPAAEVVEDAAPNSARSCGGNGLEGVALLEKQAHAGQGRPAVILGALDQSGWSIWTQLIQECSASKLGNDSTAHAPYSGA